MPALQCNFTISVNSRGGKCNGVFTGDPLISGSSFPINVTCTGLGPNQAAPALTGYFIVSAAATAQGQSNSTPFTASADSNAMYVCYWTQQRSAASSQPGQATYNFESLPYYGGARGSYELTVVFMTDSGQQYSDDPEFDTGV